MTDEHLIARARMYAADAHLGQTRKYTGDPYIVHPIAVAEMVRRHGGTDTMIAAALLHDVIEDTDRTYGNILYNFGVDVAELVLELTDRYTKEAYPDKNRKWRKSKEADRLATVSAEARIIKWCDLADNTSTIVEHDPGFAKVFLREKAELLEKMGF